MPLTEFLKMSKGKMDATHQRASTPTAPSRPWGTGSRPDTDCVELVWENGQIMTQGQSSKTRKNTVANNHQTLVSKSPDAKNANGSKMAKFSTMDSVLSDFPLPVPSREMGLDQGCDMVPWLSYSIEDPLHNEYTSDFLQELSGVTLNEHPAENHLAARGRKSDFHGASTIDDAVGVKLVNPDKGPLIAEKHTRGGSSEVPQFSLPFQDVYDASGSNAGESLHVTSQDSFCNPSSLCALTSLRLQKLNAGQPSTSSSFTNFNYFARLGAVARANHPIINSSNKLENDHKWCDLKSSNHADSALVNLSSVCSLKETRSHNQFVLAPANGNSESLPTKPVDEMLSSDQVACQEYVVKNDASGVTMTKAGMTVEGNKEPVVATSSVCSGNGVGKASNEPARDLKRKSRETGDSEGPSEEVEDESVEARKTAPSRKGSKKNRAAQVHNLSERRRRDRINEKMRALQELIPNCNKVDKASMLDEAIEYLKTLQLQVRIMSMGAGFYMQHTMLPPGMQPIHGIHMPCFSPTGVGMGMGIGYGMNMLDTLSSVRMMPLQGLCYPVPGVAPTFQGMPGSSFHPSQGLPMPMHRAPVIPSSGVPLKIPMGSHFAGFASSTDLSHLAPSCSLNDVRAPVVSSNNVSGHMSLASNQATNQGVEHPGTSHDHSSS